MSTVPRGDQSQVNNVPANTSQQLPEVNQYSMPTATHISQSAPGEALGQSGQHLNVTINNATPTPPVQFVTGKTGHGLLTRLIWFLFVGWWLSAVFVLLGYLFSLTLILLPVGIWFLHRAPQAQTLRDRTRAFTQEFKDGVWVVTEGTQQQRPFLLRALYTILVGFWIGALWLSVAWLVSLPVVTLPLSIWMIDRAPAFITLQRH